MDEIFSTKQHIQYIKKDLMNSQTRQLAFLAELYELYKSKDLEIDRLAVTLHMTMKDKEEWLNRRDKSFKVMLDYQV